MEGTKSRATHRLKIIKGQIGGLGKQIIKGAYCMDILTQLSDPKIACLAQQTRPRKPSAHAHFSDDGARRHRKSRRRTRQTLRTQ